MLCTLMAQERDDILPVAAAGQAGDPELPLQRHKAAALQLGGKECSTVFVDKLLSLTLQFRTAAEDTASRFEVYYDPMLKGAGADATWENSSIHDPNYKDQDWIWLGSAFSHEFRFCDLQVPERINGDHSPVTVVHVLCTVHKATFSDFRLPS